MSTQVFIMADGENLVLRFQSMLQTGRAVRHDVQHWKDSFVWSPESTTQASWFIVRASYYTTQVADETKLNELRNKIASVEYQFLDVAVRRSGKGTLCPHVFKKQRRGLKTKSVDINICVDALRHAYNNSLDALILLSGDGDYIPLIKEVMRQGKQVWVGAFSDGCSSELPRVADAFYYLDDFFFKASPKK
jgi:uncharacterized LabA/DUF88 family protein